MNLLNRKYRNAKDHELSMLIRKAAGISRVVAERLFWLSTANQLRAVARIRRIAAGRIR